LTQVNGLAPSFHCRVKASIMATSSLTLQKLPRRPRPRAGGRAARRDETAELGEVLGTTDPIEQGGLDGGLDLDAGGYSVVHGVVS
jgi:hypothetical protein